MITLIKLIHTLVWVTMASAIFYVLYAGIANKSGLLLLLSIGLIVFETVVLVLNKWTCPLTPWARKYSSEEKDNFDIYLPNWLAKHNKTIFGTLFALGAILTIINWIKNL